MLECLFLFFFFTFYACKYDRDMDLLTDKGLWLLDVRATLSTFFIF
jgi:hypothetical protein